MKYTIYKTTCHINGKIYIGKHQTDDPNDEYIGSGKLLNLAINKYGIENFHKEVLFVFDSEEEMNAKEEELVTEEFCSREDTYNLCNGGNGGFSYLNRSDIQKFHGRKHSNGTKDTISKKMKGNSNSKGQVAHNKGKPIHPNLMKAISKPKSEEHKRKLSESIRKRNAGVA